MVSTRRVLTLVICLAISVIGLLLFFKGGKGTNWAELGAALRGANYLYVLPALLLTLSTYCLRAYRWQILLKPLKPIRWIHLLSATTIGFMANCVFPGRVGEFVRAGAIGIKEHMSPATALTTVIVERIFDLLAVAVFVVIVLVLMPADGPAMISVRKAIGDPKKWGLVIGGITVGAFILMLLVKRFPSAALGVGGVPLRVLPKGLRVRAQRILMGLIVGLESLDSVAQVLYLALLSVLHWALQVGSNMALGYCFGLPLSFADGSLIFVITAGAVAVPQGPGFVGVLDYAVLISLQALSVDANTARSYAIVLHAVAVLPVTLLGFAFLWWEGLSFRQVTTAQKQA